MFNFSKKFEEFTLFTKDKFEEITKYFTLLPNSSQLKKDFFTITENVFNYDDLKDWLNENLSIGSIDVNIMTKVDKSNFFNNEELDELQIFFIRAKQGFKITSNQNKIILLFRKPFN